MENDSQAWSRYSAAIEALTGIRPSPGDSISEHNFRIWLIGYHAGLNDAETKRRIART